MNSLEKNMQIAREVRDFPCTLSRIGQGCMGIGGQLEREKINEKEQVFALKYGIDKGLTLLDTAEAYAEGYSEIIVGKAIRGIRENVFVATKFSPENSTYDRVISAADASLRRLQTDYIDLYQAHWPNPRVNINETMSALQSLVKAGKVKYVGLSNFSKQEMIHAQQALSELKIFSNQQEYNLFDRFVEVDILPFCKEINIPLIAYTPLDRGLNGTNISTEKVMKKLSEKYEVSFSQIALNWLVSRGNVIPIPKAIKLEHIKENSKALEFVMDSEDSKLIDSTFTSRQEFIPTDQISVSIQGEGNRKVYRNLDEAIRNELNFSPSPSELAEAIKKGEKIKPVRLILRKEVTNGFRYDLVEGRIRYWAWVLAFNGKKPIPSYVR